MALMIRKCVLSLRCLLHLNRIRFGWHRVSLFFQNIQRVDLRKSDTYDHSDVTEKVAVRIGNTDNRNAGRVYLSTNTICGKWAPSKPNRMILTSYICSPGIDGRYLTAQSTTDKYVYFTEVDVYRVGEEMNNLLGFRNKILPNIFPCSPGKIMT